MQPPSEFMAVDSVGSLAPFSAWRIALGIFITVGLIVGAVVLGNAARHVMSTMPDGLRVDDPVRGVAYIADTHTGDVRVIKLRNGIGELAHLRDARRTTVSGLGLSQDGRTLVVAADGLQYVYDTQTHALIDGNTRLAGAATAAAQ
ncbi:MAG: hypothetical protein QM639_05865 [Rhodocyclaceae bacterium]|jgi:hypothetical protein